MDVQHPHGAADECCDVNLDICTRSKRLSRCLRQNLKPTQLHPIKDAIQHERYQNLPRKCSKFRSHFVQDLSLLLGLESPLFTSYTHGILIVAP